MMVAQPALNELEMPFGDPDLFQQPGFSSVIDQKGNINLDVDPNSETYINFSNNLRFFQEVFDTLAQKSKAQIVVPSYIEGKLKYRISFDVYLESIDYLNFDNQDRGVNTPTDILIDAIRTVAQKYDIDGRNLFNSIKPFIAFNTQTSSFVFLSPQRDS